MRNQSDVGGDTHACSVSQALSRTYPAGDSGSITQTPAVHYDADVAESGGSRFIVTGRGLNLIVIHADPERQFCHELTLRGVPDGPIQFYRSDHGGMASVSFKSIYRAAKRCTNLRDKFPSLEQRHPPMSDEAKIRVSLRRRSLQDTVTDAPGYPGSPEKRRSVREAVTDKAA